MNASASRSSNPVEPTLVLDSDELKIVSLECLLICRFPRGVTRVALDRSFDMGLRIARAYPGGYCPLTIANVAILPDEATRRRAADHLSAIAPFTKVGVVLVDGEGVMATAARAVLAGIQLLSRKRADRLYASSVVDASAVLSRAMSDYLGRAVAPTEVLRAIALTGYKGR